MKTSEIIEDAFKYPVSNFKRLACFGLILLVYVLSIRLGFWAFKYSPLYIVPAALGGLTALIFTLGYYLRAMKFSLKGENEIPELNDWKEMFKDGIRMIGAGFLYFLIPGIFIFAVVSVALVSRFQNTFSMWTAVFMIVAALVYLTVTFLFMMGQANMAYRGKLGDALSLRQVIDVIKKIGVLRYILLCMVVFLLVGVILVAGCLVNLIPLVGVVITSLFISSYSNMFQARAFALIYQEGMQKGSQDADVPRDGSVTSENTGLEGAI